MTDRVKGMLGITKKAGKLATGEFACEKSVKGGKAKLCLIASDASDNTRKKFEDLCRHKNTKCIVVDITGSELGALAGQSSRTMAAVEDSGLAQGLIKLIEGGIAQ